MTYEIKMKGELVARVKTVQVTVDMSTKKSQPIGDEQRAFLTKYLETEK
jgi:acyl-CoA thioester hydrolase